MRDLVQQKLYFNCRFHADKKPSNPHTLAEALKKLNRKPMKPFFSIWISPRKTFEYLATREDSKNGVMINVLVVLIAIGLAIPRVD